MPLSPEEHLDNLVRHLNLVRDACLLLGKRLMSRNKQELGRLLVAAGFQHDVSKFYGIEWDYLHAGKDVPQDRMNLAIEHHRHTNPHHPEYWGGVDNMPEISVAEMVCDWYARSQEFGTDLRVWIRDTAMARYDIEPTSERFRRLQGFVEMLLCRPFGPPPGQG